MLRAQTGVRVTSRPAIVTRPLSAETQPATIRKSVVFDPEGPSREVKLPFGNCTEMSVSTGAVP
nr:hypothetical protein [Sinirhodobacter populi]